MHKLELHVEFLFEVGILFAPGLFHQRLPASYMFNGYCHVDFLAEASSDEEPALAAPVVPAADAADAVPARRRRARRADRDVAEPRVSIYGMPSERTELQHALLTAKMREKKAQTRYRKACTAQAADLVNQFNDLIASSGVPSRTALSLQVPRWMSGKSHKRKHIGNLKIIATTHRRMAPISKLAMAYSGVHCIKSLATMSSAMPPRSSTTSAWWPSPSWTCRRCWWRGWWKRSRRPS